MHGLVFFTPFPDHLLSLPGFVKGYHVRSFFCFTLHIVPLLEYPFEHSDSGSHFATCFTRTHIWSYIVILVIAIELLAACQAMELLRPLKTTPPLEEVHKLVRSKVGYVL